jgi:hypothetical protein
MTPAEELEEWHAARDSASPAEQVAESAAWDEGRSIADAFRSPFAPKGPTSEMRQVNPRILAWVSYYDPWPAALDRLHAEAQQANAHGKEVMEGRLAAQHEHDAAEELRVFGPEGRPKIAV